MSAEKVTNKMKIGKPPSDSTPCGSPLPTNNGIVAYYDGSRYLVETPRDYVPMDRQSIVSHLKRRGHKDPEGYICETQIDRYVRYAGPLAGKLRGCVQCNGALLLATSDPSIIKPAPGPCPTILSFITKLLGGDEHREVQIRRFIGWLAVGRAALVSGVRRPGQAIILAGPRSCGKTQFIRQVIVPVLGGRLAMAHKYFSGKTTFNGDLVGAEVLVIDDEAGSTRIEARRAIGESIKSNIFSGAVRIEGKFRAGFTFEPLWRVVIACNDEPESLMVLPPLSNDLMDKLMVFRCSRSLELTDPEFDEWRAAVAAELPQFVNLLARHKIEEGDADYRCGVSSFFHPQVVESMLELSPEHQLAALIRQAEAGESICLPWEGTAVALRGILTGPGASTRSDADRLLGSWVAATGVYLGRLVGKGVERLPMLDGDNRWKITLESGEVDTILNTAPPPAPI